jgi:hypothetical protein
MVLSFDPLFHQFQHSPQNKIWGGIRGAIHHSGDLPFGQIAIREGVVQPEHQHPHEQ